MHLSRREALKVGAGVLAGLAAGNVLAADKKKVPVALQLYSVRDDCARDLPGVLKAVAKMGYDGVEFAGYHGRTAEQLRQLLDENGLKCCGTHIQLKDVSGDELAKTVAFNKVLGNPYLIVAYMPTPATREKAVAVAKEFATIAAKLKPQGMKVGYHAHGGDFKKIDGETFWDIFFANAGPDVVMQLDLGNCLGGGGDPLAILKKFPGQSATIHLKEHGGKKGAVIGEGEVKWDEVFRLCEGPGGTKWYIVEQESYDGSPLESCRKCREGLKKMGR